MLALGGKKRREKPLLLLSRPFSILSLSYAGAVRGLPPCLHRARYLRCSFYLAAFFPAACGVAGIAIARLALLTCLCPSLPHASRRWIMVPWFRLLRIRIMRTATLHLPFAAMFADCVAGMRVCSC
jgi:hypothetical protein